MNLFRPRTSAFVLLFASAAVLPSFCATRSRALSGSPAGGAGEWANALARLPSVTPDAWPDADEVSLFEWEETCYGTNGTYTTTWTSLSKILTQRGLEGNRTFSFSNNDFYGSTTVLVARVHSPDGTARDVDLGANLAEAVDTGSLASNIHDPNDKTFTLAFPELAVGDAVEVSMRRVAKRPRCEGVYSDYLTFESDHPILFQGVRITGPASMPLRSRAFRDAGPVSLEHAASTNEEAGTITEVWTAGETPRYFAEPDMPPAYDCTARLLLSTAPDWESLSRWYARLCAPHLAATNAAMAEKVASILRDVVAQDRATGGQGEDAEPDGEAGPLREGAAERGEAGGALRAESGIPETGKPDFETACRIEFREMDDEWKLEQLSELWFQLARCRVEEARLREDLLSLSETALGPGETLAKARQAVKCAEDAENEEDPLPARVQSLSESERDAFLENVWVERLTEIRRLEEAIGSLKERIQIVCHSWPRDDEFEEEARPRAQREAAIRSLFDFVSREVRYMGAMAESEAPGYEPHDVSLTFDNRYGVCRDKAALLVAMLRMAGIDAWPVLINVGPRKDPQVPQPYFNHAIVAADSGDPADPYLLMDPTSETTRSLLPEYLCEMSYLVARDEGEGIRETPPLPVEQNLLRAETVYTLHADASADVTTTLSFAGVNDTAYRGYFASIPRDGLRAFFERVLQGIPGAVLTRWELRPAPEDLRKSPEPLVATVEYAIAEAARGAEDGRAALLDLPTVPAALAIASRVVGDLGLEKRRFPLVTDYPCGWEETVEIRLPDGVALSPESAAERQSE